jgi:hypothetical protein
LANALQFLEETLPKKLLQWKQELRQLKKRGQRTVIWGSGSKAVAYLTTMGIHSEIEYVVDINPYKYGMYLAGTGHEIVPPAFLKEYRPDVVIVMNSIYTDEIRHDLERMGVIAELIEV